MSEDIQAARNLLAVMHRDGGHHTDKVGFAQSCRDAEQVRHALLKALGAKKPHHTVVVGCYQDKSGLYLVQERVKGLCGGLWEWPGGKMDPGETMHQTLRREWQEELGVEINVAEYLTDCTLEFPESTALLVLFRIRSIGPANPSAREGQTLDRVALAEMARRPQTPASKHYTAFLQARS